METNLNLITNAELFRCFRYKLTNVTLGTMVTNVMIKRGAGQTVRHYLTANNKATNLFRLHLFNNK